MIIVVGHLQIAPGRREEYLDTCREPVRLAREAAGCRHYAAAADLLDPDRVTVAECWDDVASLEAFRTGGPSGQQQQMIEGGSVMQCECSDGQQLLG